MDLFRGSDRFSKARTLRSVAAIGIFDGVHRGHASLIRRAVEEAATRDACSIAYTFDPHPVRELSPEQCPKLITTIEQRLALIGQLGVDGIIVEEFTRDFSRRSPENFFEEIVAGRMAASAVVIGYDFTFGMHRQGTIETFERLGAEAGVDVIVIPAVFENETLVSSTIIRSMIAEGGVTRAAALLGRPHEIVGTVVSGRGFGRALEARTANIETASELIPGDGVYVTRSTVHRGGFGSRDLRRFDSVTSVGDNPTFADSAFAVETHLIDVEEDVMGETMSVEFLERMRDQSRFLSVEELRTQIHRDIEAAREYHERPARRVKGG